MAHYIDKSALVAEIERLAEVGRNNASGFDEYRKEKATWLQQADVCDRIISFIDTLEVKEVDLEKGCLTWEDIRDILDLYDEVTSMDYCNDIYGEVLKRFKAQKGE